MSAPARRPLRVVVVPKTTQRRVYAWRRRRRDEWLHTRIFGQLPSSTIRLAEWLVRQPYDAEHAAYVMSVDKAAEQLRMPRRTVIRNKARLLDSGRVVQVRRGTRRSQFSLLRIVV